jgi:two-component system response regulator YesN
MLKRMVMVYIFLFTLVVSIGVTAYIATMQTMETHTTSLSLEAVKSLEDSIGVRMSEIDAIARQLASDINVNRAKRETDSDNKIHFPLVHYLVNSMTDYKAYNNLVISNFIIYPKSNTIISKGYADDCVSFYRNRMWDGYEKQNSNTGFLSWTDMPIEKRQEIESSCNAFLDDVFARDGISKILSPRFYRMNNTDYTAIPYVRWLHQTNPFSEPGGAVVIMLNSEELADMMLSVCASSNSYAYITDSHGTVLASTNKDKPVLDLGNLEEKEGLISKKADGRNLMVTYMVSENNDWRYIVVNDKLDISNIAGKIIKPVTLIILGFILAVVIVEAVISYSRIKSLVGTYRIISRHGYEPDRSQTNLLDYISSTVEKMLNDKNELASMIKRHEPILKETVSLKLIKGEYTDYNEVKALLDQIQYKKHGDYFGAIIISFAAYWEKINQEVMDELAVKKAVIREVVEKLGYGQLYCDTGKTEMAVILNYAAYDLGRHQQQVEEIRQKIAKVLPKGSRISFTIAAGGLYEGILNVTKSYYEAQHALDYLNWDSGKEILWGDQLSYDEKNFHYIPEFEIRLINTVKSGDLETTRQMLKETFTENFIKKQLSPNMSRLLLYNLCGTLIKLDEQLVIEDETLSDGIQDIVENIDDFSNMVIHEKITDLFESLCEYAHANKKSHNIRLVQQIIDYIAENYGDSNLGLTDVAVAFNISEGYLSRFFKEQTGCALSEYIEDIRMKEARRLILKSSETISNIGRIVGYNSLNSFSRAFKRYYGISASNMRETGLVAEGVAHSNQIQISVNYPGS